MCTYFWIFSFKKIKHKSNACKLWILFKLPCKMDDFPKLDLECLMKLFSNEIQIMSLESIYLCNFYFDMTYINDNKACNQSNQVKFDFLEEEERERVLEALKINRGAF